MGAGLSILSAFLIRRSEFPHSLGLHADFSNGRTKLRLFPKQFKQKPF